MRNNMHHVFPIAIVWLIFVGLLPWFFFVYALLVNVLSYVLYVVDKQKAVRTQQRLPEKTLLMVDALGGWYGGRLAQLHLHHKVSKAAYQRRFVGSMLFSLVFTALLSTLYLAF